MYHIDNKIETLSNNAHLTTMLNYNNNDHFHFLHINYYVNKHEF